MRGLTLLLLLLVCNTIKQISIIYFIFRDLLPFRSLGHCLNNLWIPFRSAWNGRNFLFQLVNRYKSHLYSISFQIPTHYASLHLFWSIPLNFTRRVDFNQHVNVSLFFFLNLFFLITSLLFFFFKKLLLLYLHMTFYCYFPLIMFFLVYFIHIWHGFSLP